MRKMILGALAALTALIAAPVMAADPTPPAQVQIMVVQLGHLEGRDTTVTKGDRHATVTLDGCETSWKDGQDFYMLGAAGAPPVLIRKDILDYALQQTNNDWDVAFKAIVAANLACIVTAAK